MYPPATIGRSDGISDPWVILELRCLSISPVNGVSASTAESHAYHIPAFFFTCGDRIATVPKGGGLGFIHQVQRPPSNQPIGLGFFKPNRHPFKSDQ